MIKGPAIMLLAILSSTPAMAETLSLSPMFKEAGEVWGVSADLTRAIAGVESGLSPWVLNIEGKGYAFDSKEEAVKKAREAEAAGRSFDSGLMQVNNSWLDKYGIPLEAAFDPLANIYLGSWILRQEINRYGRTWQAVGSYHSPDVGKGRQYAELVKKALERSPAKIKSGHKTARQAVVRNYPDLSPMVVSRRDRQIGGRTLDDGYFVKRLNGGKQ